MSNFKKVLEKLKDKQSNKKLLLKQQENFKKRADKLEKDIENLVQARTVIQIASQVTQRSMSTKIAKTVSIALASVFQDPYTFVLKFEKKRNVTECRPVFIRRGKERTPLKSCGYGTADIAALALRVSYVNMDNSAYPIMILDEPTRNLDIKRQPLASIMVKELSKLGIQFILVTHNNHFTEASDRIFSVDGKDDISTVKVKK